ncbi:phage baseplate assembly protein V [Tenacibaculum sp.]|nr:phage baseplate assembly protein V [Tenacibaculum sp.]
MALQSITSILIGETEISAFKFLELQQNIDEHHTLELVCRMDVLENLENELANESKNFLGETITLQIAAAEGFETSHELQFKGIVTQIQTIKGHQVASGDEIIITAQSTTFLTNDGPHFASHNDVSLSEIINKTLEGYDTSKLEVVVQPQNDPTLHYSVQQNESAYNYVSRLAALHGEWFYYNGSQLIFGAPDTEELELTYGFDLKEYQLKLLPQSNNYNFFANDYLTDEIHQKATSEVSSSLNGHGAFVSGKSDTIFNKETNVWHNLYDDPQTQQRLDIATELQKKSIEVKQIQVSGTSDNTGLKLGSIITIEGSKFRVTSIIHTNNETGDYLNKFKGITADVDSYPYTNINAFPKSESQIATVKENADPDSLGRIKVQFPWQEEENEMTPWIRIVSPHGGANKGFHFIPEIDEKVLIGFEGGNAERPYMLGVLYTSNAKPEEFATETNDAKIIRTRSGHTIELNDTDGEEKINIYDNEGSIITFDTQAKSLHITATENLELQAKNIKMTAEENIELVAQGEIKTASEADTSIQAQGAIKLQSDSDTTIKSSANATIEATSNAELKGQSAKIEGKMSAELKGTQTKIAGSATAEVSGGIVKIN